MGKAPPTAVSDCIELLGPSLLDEERAVVKAVTRLARTIRISLGWHYLLDVAWTNRQIDATPGSTILDAGAGVGIMQWYLADQGVNVLSVDRLDRSRLSGRLRARYRVASLRPNDLSSIASSLLADARTGALAVDAIRNVRALADRARGSIGKRGTVTIHHAPLDELGAIPDGSVDHIVSISSLEHNEPNAIPSIVAELFRVLRPGGLLTATVGAAKSDQYHEPSRGWCFSEATLRSAFGLADEATSNYDRFDEILEAVRASDELRLNLAKSYFRSGNNGMPWGKWDPAYLSVGIRRQKPF